MWYISHKKQHTAAQDTTENIISDKATQTAVT